MLTTAIADDSSQVCILTKSHATHNRTLILHTCILSLRMFTGMCSAFAWEDTKQCLFRGGRW